MICKPKKGLVLQALAIFWTKFNRTRTQVKKLDMLREISEVSFGSHPQQKRSLRTRFNKKKKKFQWGDCRVCGVPSQLLHHIVQIQNGGHNHSRNLMPLCHHCHAEVHPWLKAEEAV